MKKKFYHMRDIDTTKTLNMDQILLLLEESKNTPIRMQVLFNVLMGLRRKEINAVKYSDVDYVFEAILEEREKYERWRSRMRSIFHDDGYIYCSNYSGKPRNKDFYSTHYKELLKRTGVPDFRWHDLRSTYCTLLLNNDFSPEADREQALDTMVDMERFLPEKEVEEPDDRNEKRNVN